LGKREDSLPTEFSSLNEVGKIIPENQITRNQVNQAKLHKSKEGDHQLDRGNEKEEEKINIFVN
jgi:hypothetical protein